MLQELTCNALMSARSAALCGLERSGEEALSASGELEMSE